MAFGLLACLIGGTTSAQIFRAKPPRTGNAIVAQATTSGTTELNVVSYQIPAGSISAGTTFHIYAQMVYNGAAGAGTNNVLVRYGTNDSSGTQLFLSQPTGGTGASTVADIECVVTFRTTTTAATNCQIINSGTTGLVNGTFAVSQAPQSVSSLDTTTAKYLQFAFAATSNASNSGAFNIAEIDTLVN